MPRAGSNYLDGEESLFSLPSPLPSGLGEQASAIVDNYIKRPEGMLYVADKNGNPSYMKALTPSFTYQIVGALTPGPNVQATVTPANLRPDMVGEVLILDRVNPDLMEAVVVSSIVGNNQIILANVQFNHDAGTKADVGMIITEERGLPAKRSIGRISKFPCPAILSLMGRIGYGRRGDQISGAFQEMNLLADLASFGGPPIWQPVTISATSWSDATGEIWVPASMYMVYYSEIKVKYVAGFLTPPSPLVEATASIAASLVSSAQYGGGNIKSFSAGDSRVEKFGSTNIDVDTRHQLDVYKARIFF